MNRLHIETSTSGARPSLQMPQISQQNQYQLNVFLCEFRCSRKKVGKNSCFGVSLFSIVLTRLIDRCNPGRFVLKNVKVPHESKANQASQAQKARRRSKRTKLRQANVETEAHC